MKIVSLAKTRIGLLLVSSAVSLILIVGIFEAIENIRYYHWKADIENAGPHGRIMMRSPNPVLMWEYRPYGEFGQIKINRYGFRDRDYESRAKPENVYRVAFIGDSVTLGLRVGVEETCDRQLETAANQQGSGQTVQALNFGVAGYSTPQIHEILRTKVLDFAPDRVVYLLCLNDFDVQGFMNVPNVYSKPKSFLLFTLEKAYRKLRGGDIHLYHFGKNKEVVFQHLVDMRAQLEGEGIGFQVVIVPVFLAAAASFEDCPLRGMHKEIGEFLDVNGIPYLDLLEAFTEQGRPPKFYGSDIWHPNADGYRLMAQRILASISSE